MQAAGVDKGAGDPPAGKNLILLANAPNPALPGDIGVPTVGYKEIGSVTLKHIYEIAKIKKQDEHLKHIELESLARSVMGTCRNIGIRVTRELASLISQRSLSICTDDELQNGTSSMKHVALSSKLVKSRYMIAWYPRVSVLPLCITSFGYEQEGEQLLPSNLYMTLHVTPQSFIH